MLAVNQIYNMDVFDFLNHIDNNTIDLAVIDPPYNLKIADWDDFDSTKSFLDFTYKYIDNIIPKLKDTSGMYIFNTPLNMSYIIQYIIQKGMRYQNYIVWDKRDGQGSTKSRYINRHESILYCTVSDNYTFNVDAIRLQYTDDRFAKGKGIIKNGKRWYPNPKGKLCSDVWHISSERHNNKKKGKTTKQLHPSMKPIKMIERIILASSNQNDIVLDPFCGSGTVPLIAKKLNRRYIANDRDINYTKIATQRISGILDSF